jgi:hypothetical protein
MLYATGREDIGRVSFVMPLTSPSNGISFHLPSGPISHQSGGALQNCGDALHFNSSRCVLDFAFAFIEQQHKKLRERNFEELPPCLKPNKQIE